MVSGKKETYTGGPVAPPRRVGPEEMKFDAQILICQPPILFEIQTYAQFQSESDFSGPGAGKQFIFLRWRGGGVLLNYFPQQ